MRPKGISVERYKELAEQGMTMPEAAKVLGVSKPTVQGMAKRHGIVFARGKGGGKRVKRD